MYSPFAIRGAKLYIVAGTHLIPRYFSSKKKDSLHCVSAILLYELYWLIQKDLWANVSDSDSKISSVCKIQRFISFFILYNIFFATQK